MTDTRDIVERLRDFMNYHANSDGGIVQEVERGLRASGSVDSGEPDVFEASRSPNWRGSLDAEGKPTHGPATSAHPGCHHCSGDLDAKHGSGQYECPWCIARYPGAEVVAPDPIAWAPIFEDEEFDTVRDGLLYDAGGQLVAFFEEADAKKYTDRGYPLAAIYIGAPPVPVGEDNE